MNKEEIKKIIPYQHPFLFVDQVKEITDNSITGIKKITGEEKFFKGHFVNFPIMPGVLIAEGIAQTGTILVREKIPQHEKKLVLAYQIQHAEFSKPIFPPATIKYEVELHGIYGNRIANLTGRAFVDDKLKATIRFVCAVVDKEDFKNKYLVEEPHKIFELPPLKIGHKIAKIPIIQGGMAVRISMGKLAGAVAKAGAVGTIAISGMLDKTEVIKEISKAKKISRQLGLIATNIMGVAHNFVDLVKSSLQSGVDLIIQGAGFRKEIYELCRKANVPVINIASSAKVARKSVQAGASAIIVEGKEAGGHLGFPPGHDFRSTKDILPEVVSQVSVPVIAAGGVWDGKDIVDMLRMGAAGVQMATRFVITNECSAPDNFKQAYLNAEKDDITIIESPVGLPGRAIMNKGIEKIRAGKGPQANPKECEVCMRMCQRQYCILKCLDNAQKGDLNNGIIFAGENAYRSEEIVSTSDLIKELVNKANQILAKNPLVK